MRCKVPFSRSKFPGLSRTSFNTLMAALRLHSWSMKLVVLCYKQNVPITMMGGEVAGQLLAMGILKRLDERRLWIAEKYEDSIAQTSVSELIDLYPEIRHEVAVDHDEVTLSVSPISGVQETAQHSSSEEELDQRQTA